MLSSIAASGFNFRSLLSLGNQAPTTVGSPADSSEGTELQTPSPSGLLDAGDVFQEQTSLQLRAQSQLRVMDDGDTLATAQARLKFSYDFQAADGSTIQVRVRANLNYAQLTDADEASQTTKLKAALHISVLQENVASGVGELQEDPNTPVDVQDMISQALDLFQEMTDMATSQFQGSDPMDGDSLVTGVVDAFNDLAMSVTSAFLPAADTTEPAADVVDVPTIPTEEPTEEPTEVATSTPDTSTVEMPVAVEVPLPEIISADPAEETATDEAAAESEETPAATEEATPETEDTTSDTEVAQEPSTTTLPGTTPSTSTSAAEATMIRVRLQVIQSLRGLVRVFGGDSSGQSSGPHHGGMSHGAHGWSNHHQHHFDCWR